MLNLHVKFISNFSNFSNITSIYGATSDFTAYGVKISLLKAFESFQIV